jgi:hypothetical protein
MAAWRIEHLEWRERVGDQIAKYFNTTTGSQPTALLSSPTPPKN